MVSVRLSPLFIIERNKTSSLPWVGLGDHWRQVLSCLLLTLRSQCLSRYVDSLGPPTNARYRSLFSHVVSVRSSFTPICQNKAMRKRKQCSLLARLWVELDIIEDSRLVFLNILTNLLAEILTHRARTNVWSLFSRMVSVLSYVCPSAKQNRALTLRMGPDGFLKIRQTCFLIHAQAQTKAQAWKVFITSGDGVRPYVQNKTDQRVKPLFKLVLCFAWISVRLKSCRSVFFSKDVTYFTLNLSQFYGIVHFSISRFQYIFTGSLLFFAIQGIYSFTMDHLRLNSAEDKKHFWHQAKKCIKRQNLKFFCCESQSNCREWKFSSVLPLAN